MVADPQEQGQLRPSFDNVRGGMHGYSPTDTSPSFRNRQAFLDELSGSMVFDEGYQPSDWEEVLGDVQRQLAFWKQYYCGVSQ